MKAWKVEAAQIEARKQCNHLKAKLQALGDKKKGIRLSPGRPKQMEHSTKTSRKTQKPAGRQRPAETPADWQRSQQAGRAGRNADRQAERPAGRQRPAETPAGWQRSQYLIYKNEKEKYN